MNPPANLFEFTDSSPQLDVQEAEYVRLLGYPQQHSLENRPRELATWARGWYAEHGRPWIFARAAGGLEINGGKIRLSGVEFSSRELEAQLLAAEAHDAMLVAVSAGKECEEKAAQSWEQGWPDEYFFLEMYGSAVVEHLITRAAGRICAWADLHGLGVLPHYSPGYAGWPITDQSQLWSILQRDNGLAFPAPLEVLPTGMLRPKKSLLALFGLTRQLDKVQSRSNMIPCENCSLQNCQYRRAPYVNPPQRLDELARLQNHTTRNPAGKSRDLPAFTRAGSYSVNIRALRKWSQERLDLEHLPDGGIEAKFRYEGTTCSSLGQPLEFRYRVKLSSTRDGFRITEADCAPAPGDFGHTQQCEYLSDSASLMSRIAIEKPLLGRPLNDVLAWERPPAPSGCYCDTAGRAHKWGLVFEVIHFALVEQERQLGNGHSPADLKQTAANLKT